MKEFFKNRYNIVLCIMFGVGLISIPLIVISWIFYMLFCLCFSVGCVMCAINSIKKYKNRVNYDPQDEIFDASEYSYEEGQYFVGEGRPQQKIRGIGKMEAFVPSLLFICLSCIFIGMTIFSIISLL